jgi:hypothetical protein
MLTTPDISKSCWREVAPSTDWVFNVNGTISFPTSRANGPKSSDGKHQGSPQVSMPSDKAVSRRMTAFKCQENQLAVFLTEIHHPATRSLVECAGTNAGRFENCGRYHQIVPKVGRGYLWFGMFPVEKANDYSLLELHEKWPILNLDGYHWKMKSYSSTSRERKFDRQALKLTLVSSLNDMCRFLEKM